LAKSLSKCAQDGPISLQRCPVEEADHRHCLLLRVRHERPRDRRTAEKYDQFTSLHPVTSSASGWVSNRARARSVPLVGYQNSTTPGYGREILRCGILTRLMTAEGQKPALPRRSIAVRFHLNKQTPTGRVQCDAL